MKSWLRGKKGGLLAFLGICILVIGGLGWVTAAVLRLEESQYRADFEKELSARLSLVMWRLDSRVAPALAREDSRPYNHYNAVFAPAVLVRNNGTPIKPGEALEPSPLLSEELPDWMLLHFQTDAELGWESPQVLSRNLIGVLENPRVQVPLDNVTPQRCRLLVDLDRSLPPKQVLSCCVNRLQPDRAGGQGSNREIQQQADQQQVLNPSEALAQPPIGQQAANDPGQNPSYNRTNDQESVKRRSVQERVQKESPSNKLQMADLNQALANTTRNGEAWFRSLPPQEIKQTTVRLEPMVPLWLAPPNREEQLVIARLIQIGDRQRCQGVVLDWPRLQEVLAEEAREAFPEARFEPVRSAEPENPELAMKWLPVQLDPGPLKPPTMPVWTPLRRGLALVWAAALVALSAVGLGGWSLIDLSERRIRFVSAVTHELRTPLTTLRLYLDMLTGGLVKEEQQKTEYLATLHAETERLNRLVANVLDFSRLENQRPRLEKTAVKVAELLEQVHNDWHGRCGGADKELVVENSLAPDAEIATDVKLVQQVLGNLIDNACKYSRGATDRRIWLRACPDGKRLALEVEDRGPGVPAGDCRSIFRPFRRGRDADGTAGGVGLGLALAQRWTWLLGGRLTVGRGTDGGACFRLSI